MRVVILPNAEQASLFAAEQVKKQITRKPTSVLGLATGSTPLKLYKELIESQKRGEISFADASSFNLDEYLGLAPEHPQSYHRFMRENFFEHIDIDLNNTHIPQGLTDNPITSCEAYEAKILEKGGIDLQILGIGRNGHIGFNEPSSGLASRTRVKTLSPSTIDDNARFFGPDETQPTLSLTMGIGTILDSKKLVLLAYGDGKADAIKDTVEGPLSASCPASALQMHKDALVIIDESAASKLEHQEFYLHVERENQKLLKTLGL